MLMGGFFVIWFLFVFALVLAPIGFTIYALVEINRTPDAAFGPPWNNGKGAWTLGLALAFVIPFGTIVGPIVWWTQGRAALRQGRPVPRPFWSSAPAAPYPYPYQGQPGAYQGQPGAYQGQQPYPPAAQAQPPAQPPAPSA